MLAWIKDTQMCNWGYFAYDFVASWITSYPHPFLASTFLFEFQCECIIQNGSCRFISDENKNLTSFVAWNIQGNFFSHISVNQGNLAESFPKIALYLTFPYLIPHKISHVYLPKISVRMTLDKKYSELHTYVSLIYDASMLQVKIAADICVNIKLFHSAGLSLLCKF